MDSSNLLGDYLSQLDVGYIKSFRGLVNESIDLKFSEINTNYESVLSNENENNILLREFIADDALFMDGVSILADELSIVALYKIFEKKHKEIITCHTEDYDMRKLSYWNNVIPIIPEDIINSIEFFAVNELRLLNNAIKHEGSVSEELAKEFPTYGEKGNEFSELGKIYERLEPLVVAYIANLYESMKKT